MKKLTTITLIAMVLPVVGFAKVSDFNAMISENMQAQGQLHNSIKDNVDMARFAAEQEEARKEKTLVVEGSSRVYNSPTNKKSMSFEKEKSYRKDKKVGFDRIATEINEAEF